MRGVFQRKTQCFTEKNVDLKNFGLICHVKYKYV